MPEYLSWLLCRNQQMNSKTGTEIQRTQNNKNVFKTDHAGRLKLSNLKPAPGLQ